MNVVVHTDGGSRGNPGPAAIGVVIESEGKILREIAETIGDATNNVAEYRAVQRAVEALSELSPAPTKVDFFLDSLLVVQQLNRRFAIKKAELSVLATQIWRQLGALPFSTQFSHVRREQNADADRLVNRALDEKYKKA